jgi:hypothetical protein
MKIKYYIDCLYPYSEKILSNNIPQFIALQKKLFKKLNIDTEIKVYQIKDSIYPIIFLDRHAVCKQKIRVSNKLYNKYLMLLNED